MPALPPRPSPRVPSGVSSRVVRRRVPLIASVTLTLLGAVAFQAFSSSAQAAQPGTARPGAAGRHAVTQPAVTQPAVTPKAVTLRVDPYVDMGAWPTPSLSGMAAAGHVSGFTLGFITSVGCKASWFNAYDPRAKWQLSEINALRTKGGDVKVSFGGASGIELAQACTSVSALAAEYQAVVSAYQLRYVDFDIEGAAVAEPASITRRSQAIAALQKANPGLKVSLTLPVLPSGLTADGLNVVRSAKAAGVKLDMVNAMAMDYYQGAGNMGGKAKQAGQAVHNQLASIYRGLADATIWRMVGVTPMLGRNDDGSIFSKTDAGALVRWAKAKHVGQLSFWDATRDRNACTGALYMCTNVKQSPYDFSKVFAGYTG